MPDTATRPIAASPASAGGCGHQAIEPLRCSAVLTHHWLVRRRGGEKVLEALRHLLPEAPLYTLVRSREVTLGFREIHTSPLQYIPGAERHYPWLLPLMPIAARAVRLPPVDLVLCSDAALAKALRVHPRSRLVCYCHSPMRYVWEPSVAAQYARSLPAPVRPLWRPVTRLVRDADRRAAQRVDHFIANSQHVAQRIRRCYGRESVVIYPPVDVPPLPAAGPRDSFYLCVGHHVPYKRLDLAVEATRRLGRRLVVIGEGPALRDIRRRRELTLHVTLLGWQPAAVLEQYYRSAAALLFPGQEDFGMVPVEAMGHGCPVIAYGAGGAAETVVPDRTGVLFGEQTVDALVDAMLRFERLTFSPSLLHAHARQFGLERFLRQVRAELERALEGT